MEPLSVSVQLKTAHLSSRSLNPVRNSVPPVKILGITGIPDFVHRPEFQILENSTFRELDLFPFTDKGKETPTLLGPSERANLNH
jgi:hypothetical protein